MRSRFRSPIWRDVIQGTPSGVAGGRFVQNDGTEAVPYYGALVQLNGGYIVQLGGGRIRRKDRNQ